MYRGRSQTADAIPETRRTTASTACGCWIYCGVYPRSGSQPGERTRAQRFLGHGWGFSWPNDCRIIYNRASARPDGKPWSERKKLVWWDEEKKEWTGLDNPDLREKHSARNTKPICATEKASRRWAAHSRFVLHPDGVGWLFVPSGLKDGPLPTHYRTAGVAGRKSTIPNSRPTLPSTRKKRSDNPYAAFAGDPRFPYVLTTYRLTEHHTAGGMSRTLSPSGRAAAGTVHGSVSRTGGRSRACTMATGRRSVTPRGSIEARVLVTRRMRPLWIDGATIHQVGLAVSLGLQRAGERRRSQRSACHQLKSRMCASWKPRRWSATVRPGRQRRASAGHGAASSRSRRRPA